MSQPSDAIGLFDSGVGGLTILQELMRALPHERFIYLGDTARVPYGNKSAETIIRYSIENVICLLKKEIKLLIVACHTASALALPKLKQLFKIPVIGVIEPGVQQAIAATRNQRIAVLGTKGTIQSGIYQRTLQAALPQAKIIAVACPLLVPLVEEQWLTHAATQMILEHYLAPLRAQEVDTILLGCTHYPLLKPLMQQVLGESVILVDASLACAAQVTQLLQQQQLAATAQQEPHCYYASDDPDKFRQLGQHLFGYSLETVELLLPERM